MHDHFIVSRCYSSKLRESIVCVFIYKTEQIKNGNNDLQSFMKTWKLGVPSNNTNIGPEHSLQIVGKQGYGAGYRQWKTTLI